jgi:hypothetical protein
MAGAGLILIAFIMNQLHYWRDTYLIYDVINFVGSLMLVIYSYALGGYPVTILNSVWVIVSLRDIVIDLQRNGHSHKRGFFNKWLK